MLISISSKYSYCKLILNYIKKRLSKGTLIHQNLATLVSFHLAITNVAIVNLVEWVEQNQFQDCGATITLHKIMFKILALLSNFLFLHSKNSTKNYEFLQANVAPHHKVPLLTYLPLCTYIWFDFMIILCATLVF